MVEIDDVALEAELDASRAARAANAGQEENPNTLVREAWLLIALRRPSEGIEVARRAQRAWQARRARSASPSGGSLLWEACIAEAAVHLAHGRWADVERSARTVLTDFGEEETSYHLLELALHAQGRLLPDRVRQVAEDPAEELARFDLRSFALRRAGLGTGTPDRPVDRP